MNAQEIRNQYLKFFKERGHAVVPRALLVPQDDPSTLFTGSGMQPLIPYLLGQAHPKGVRIADSQTCLRAQDIEEVGDNRHTTFFEMLGNWSLGDYFKKEQLPWFFEFLTETVGLDANKLFVTCFIGDEASGIPKDTEGAEIWSELFKSKGVEPNIVEIGSEEEGYKKGMQGGRIFFYDSSKNWWSRSGKPENMPIGEPGGGDSEVFYEFDFIEHDKKWGENCHVNCDCGRYMEIGNSVFMEYIKTEKGFEKLPKQNVDFGGGMERIAAAKLNTPDIFKISVLRPIIEALEKLSGKSYESHTESMRVIADHLRAAVFLAVDGVVPSNTAQGYVMRRLMRRAIRFAFDLGAEQDLCEQIAPVVCELYKNDYPEVAESENRVLDVLKREEQLFRRTLHSGLRELNKLSKQSKNLTGEDIFTLHDTHGFPYELSLEEAYSQNIAIAENWREDFDKLMNEQRERSRTAAAGTFKGGLADHSDIVVKYHTATHLMYRALKNILGDHVVQRGSNITAERLRFDFSHDEKMTPEQIKAVEDMVNEQIEKDWPVSWREENTKEALESGVAGAFGDRYGEQVKVYTVGDPEGDNYSREICGGPHVDHTGQLGEDGKRFKILKEESSSAGVRRIKAVLV
ncbi:alanine--tRNA ligase [Candidatus Saccharibacteria bacterium]|nr:alanine--tRNA ligase [Candidatus Saccharibacteria bacterium]